MKITQAVIPECLTDCVITVVADSSAVLYEIFTDDMPINRQLQTTLKCVKTAVVTQSLNRESIE